MNKTNWHAIVALSLSALTASAGPITHGPAIEAASSGWDRALSTLALSATDQHDLKLWTDSRDGTKDVPAIWERAQFNNPAASISSAPASVPSASLAARQSPAGMFGAYAGGPLSFLMLAVSLALASYALRRTRLSAGAACG